MSHAKVLKPPLPAHERKSASVAQRPEPSPVLDERLSALALGAFEVVDTLIVSALAGVPYAAAREAVQLTDDQRAEIFEAARKAAGAHARFFAEHEDALAFGVDLAAIQAAKLEQVLVLAVGEQAQPLLLRETLGILALFFAPFLALLLIYALKRSME
jgi:hypothetical protein